MHAGHFEDGRNVHSKCITMDIAWHAQGVMCIVQWTLCKGASNHETIIMHLAVESMHKVLAIAEAIYT